MKLKVILATVASGILWLPSCGDKDADTKTTTTAVTFDAVGKPAFEAANCYVCHGADTGRDMTTLDGVKTNRTAAIAAVKGTGPNPMPPSSHPATEAEKTALLNYLENGTDL